MGAKRSAGLPAEPEQNAPSEQSSSESQAKYKLRPAGWVQIAVDYNNDGMFDGIETIYAYAYDFDKARKSSQQRANREAQKMSGRSKSHDRRQASNQRDSNRKSSNQQNRGSQQSASKESVSGKVLQLRDEQVVGMDEPCVIARIRNDNNVPAKIVLGPKSKVGSWQLAEGD